MRKKLIIKRWDKFNNLSIIGEIDPTSRWRRFVCECICGKIIESSLDHLRVGQKGCGCIRKWKHWMSWTRFYTIYKNIVQRCTNENIFAYTRYWERGIKNFWKTFEDFKEDMYESYTKHLKKHWEKNTTIDRIDNDWHYTIQNCRWATVKQQANNKSNTMNN